MIKAVACINDYALVSELMHVIQADDRLKLMALSQLPQDLLIFHSLDIDVLILDCSSNTLEALKLSQKIVAQRQLSLRIIYMFKEVDTDMIHHICKQDPQARFLVEPFSALDIIEEIVKNETMVKQPKCRQCKEEGTATLVMQELQLPLHLKGYRYIKTGAILLYHAEGGIMSMKQLYKETARIHNTTTTRVEKSIRDAIDCAYKNETKPLQIAGKKPTNSQLIHHVYEQMVLRSQLTETNKMEVML